MRVHLVANIPCWWCGQQLAVQYGKLLYHIINTPTGAVVNVHKGCVEATKIHFRKITAAPPPDMLSNGLTPQRPAAP